LFLEDLNLLHYSNYYVKLISERERERERKREREREREREKERSEKIYNKISCKLYSNKSIFKQYLQLIVKYTYKIYRKYLFVL